VVRHAAGTPPGVARRAAWCGRRRGRAHARAGLSDPSALRCAALPSSLVGPLCHSTCLRVRLYGSTSTAALRPCIQLYESTYSGCTCGHLARILVCCLLCRSVVCCTCTTVHHSSRTWNLESTGGTWQAILRTSAVVRWLPAVTRPAAAAPAARSGQECSLLVRPAPCCRELRERAARVQPY
jgi:hypothetical protein